MRSWRPALVLHQQRRHLLGGPFAPRPTQPPASSPPSAPTTMRYAERRLLGFSQEQMYAVVSGVERYHSFVPWCTASSTSDRRALDDVNDVGGDVTGPGERFTGHLSIGFPPLLQQSYRSVVTCRGPLLVHSRCSDASLFRLLDTTWRFHPGLAGRPLTCILDFGVEFAFQSSRHTAVAELFFDRVVTAMVSAFLREARRRYGPDSVRPQEPVVLVYKK